MTARFNRRKQSKRRIQDGSAASNCCFSLFKNSVMHPHPAVLTAKNAENAKEKTCFLSLSLSLSAFFAFFAV